MTAVKAHVWTFRSQFRAGAFGWRSDLPIKRIKEAVAEIKKAAASLPNTAQAIKKGRGGSQGEVSPISALARTCG